MRKKEAPCRKEQRKGDLKEKTSNKTQREQGISLFSSNASASSIFNLTARLGEGARFTKPHHFAAG
jgi:hypothetical protein